MTRSMFGIRVSTDADILRPFRAYVSWLCHLIGLHPILMYYTPSGLTLHSPERALYLNDCHSIGLHPILMYYTPSGLTLHSPERALYLNDGCSPSDRERTTITSPERALYISETLTALAKWEIYTTDEVLPLAIKTRTE
jgi:hypothetical protein